MKTLKVDLGERSYPIYIGNDLLSDSDLVKPYVKGTQVLIVSNTIVAPLYLSKVEKMFAAFNCKHIILPDGEQHKTLDTVNLIFTKLLELKFDRKCTLVALGGGVIGDITGFAASAYQRGVNFIQIPTTLLSQVDSSVGGKTGVNHSLGKNMIGAFYQPQCVIADLSTLSTLDPRQIPAGLAEIIKYGAINDPEFFTWLEQNITNILNLKLEELSYAIFVSCQNKANIVAQDETESGVRATLNFGHTFGHAIESSQGYGNWLHGEAVGVGMLMAADLSHRLGWLNYADLLRLDDIIKKADLPIKAPLGMGSSEYMKYMSVDKKVESGKIKLVLLTAIGKAIITTEFAKEKLLETLSHKSQ